MANLTGVTYEQRVGAGSVIGVEYNAYQDIPIKVHSCGVTVRFDVEDLDFLVNSLVSLREILSQKEQP